MATTSAGETWPERLAADVGVQIRRLRERPDWKMSAQTLANVTAELGHEVPRSVLANMESGRRSSVPLVDVLVLAEALRVPPALIVFGLGDGATAEALPGQQIATPDAVRWWNGERGPLLPVVDKGRVSDVTRTRAERATYEVLDMYRGHWQLIDEIRSTTAWIRRSTSKPRWERQREYAEQELAELRGEMLERGLILPALDDDIELPEPPKGTRRGRRK
ncbi:helix-turn-helix domain-containing protein [Rhodococcus sp. NPDC058514]|uniref:helix-turn-helix domain-containing protein n=1 Tax=unclassified Rhodococcus (in: high G+C Gram-positive bacteria) TaxID=192944 RepID=UPI003653A2A6